MRRDPMRLWLVALLAALAVAACGQSSGGGGGGGAGGGDGGTTTSGKATTTTSNGDNANSTHNNGPHGPVFIVLTPGKFGAIDVGAARTQELTVKNATDEPQEVQGVSIASGNEAEFVITDNQCAEGTTLEPGETCKVTVTFKPQETGARAADLQVTPKDGKASSARIQGTGEEVGQSTDSGG